MMPVQLSPAPKPGDTVIVKIEDIAEFLDRYGMEIVQGSYHAGTVVVRKVTEAKK